jgi:hypothetical protein
MCRHFVGRADLNEPQALKTRSSCVAYSGRLQWRLPSEERSCQELCSRTIARQHRPIEALWKRQRTLNPRVGRAMAATGSFLVNAASTGGTDITIIQQLQLMETFQLRHGANRGPI